MASIQEHEFDPVTCVCIHCHVPANNILEAAGNLTCAPRWMPEQVRPEPARRILAADDFDMIGDRLKELDAEKLANLAQTTQIDESG